MYSIKIRDHIMVAHSLNDEYFGPAQKLHGATYIVDVSFYSRHLNEHNVVIDIAQAQDVLKAVLEPLNYKNLDELQQFNDHITTTEFLARYIHDSIKEKSKHFFKGKIAVVLGESNVAWASYEGLDQDQSSIFNENSFFNTR